MRPISSAVIAESTSSSFDASPATIPAATATATPRSPPVLGTTTLFTFFKILPLTATSARAGIAPSVSRASAAAYATATGSVQPMAGISSSFSTLRQVSYFFRSIPQNNSEKQRKSQAKSGAQVCAPPLFYLLRIYSSMAFAAVFPAPIARMTVAAPVTASPPA